MENFEKKSERDSLLEELNKIRVDLNQVLTLKTKMEEDGTMFNESGDDLSDEYIEARKEFKQLTDRENKISDQLVEIKHRDRE